MGGPPGGIGYDVRIHPADPNIVYVTDAWAGIHKSTDRGQTWQPLNEGITSRTGPSGDAVPIFCVTIDPSHPDILWAGTIEANGVYRSEDGGAHWELRINGISDFPSDHIVTFRSFAISPADSNTVFAAMEVSRPGTDKVYGQVYRTTDAGRYWRKVLQAGNLFRRVEINPQDPRIIYAGTGIFDRWGERHEGIFKSTDGGETWTQVNSGLANLTAPYLAMDPVDPKVLYAATGGEPAFGGDPDGGVFKTVNGGQSWERLLRVPGWGVFGAVEVAPSNPQVVYAAREPEVFRSDDGGRTWQDLGFNAPGYRMGIPIGLAVDPTDPDIVYLNSYEGGVYRSDDGGRTWVSANVGYTGATVSDLAVNPHDPQHLYVSGLNGVFKSLDGGATYLGMNPQDTTFEFARSITADPQDWTVLYGANTWSGRVFGSSDGGKSWSKLGDLDLTITTLREDHSVGITAIVVSPQDPETIYVATVVGRENDPGELEQQPGLGVYKSTDGGRSWQAASNNLPSKQVFTLIMDAGNPPVLYAGTLGGVARTADGGQRWEVLNTGLPVKEVRALTIDPNNPQVLYAGTGNAGAFKSTNGGRSWQRVGAGVGAQANVRSIAVHPLDSRRVFAADWHTGVYYSEDGGQTWTRLNEGLRTRAVNKLAFARDGSVLYAGTEGEGVFRLDLTRPGGG
jgi:photosystem II stability/assembly factor-like uncharacterized protein